MPAFPSCAALLAALALFATAPPPPADDVPASPYIDFMQREIKALSAEETAELLEGHGMGLALAAELNGYPGPKHVLELTDRLDLTDEQRLLTRRAFDAMHEQAVRLGRQLIDKEAEIDRAFAESAVNGDRLSGLVLEAAALRGALRLAHLDAHVAMKRILSAEQVAAYSRLRGYATHGAPADCPRHTP